VHDLEAQPKVMYNNIKINLPKSTLVLSNPCCNACFTILLLNISMDMPSLQNRSNCTFRCDYLRLATTTTAKSGFNPLTIDKQKNVLTFSTREQNGIRKKVSTMNVNYFEKCGDMCQRKIATTMIVIMAILSVGAMLSLFIRW
jgi:hypothetical protein